MNGKISNKNQEVLPTDLRGEERFFTSAHTLPNQFPGENISANQ